MQMTKKHFEAIAKIIKAAKWEPSAVTVYKNETLRCVARQLADYFARENPRFDRMRFMRACGFGEE